MSISKIGRVLLVATLLCLGAWLLSVSSGPSAETAARQQAIQSFAPAGVDVNAPINVRPEQNGAAQPVVVNLRDIPAGVRDPNSQLDRWQRGEIDLEEIEGIRGAAEMAAMQARSLELAPSANVQLAASGPSIAAPSAGTGFTSMDYTECCGGGGNVPPDPELAVGPNHVIAVVNVALEIYDKNGNTLVGPTTFASFMSANSNCTGVFDPNANYDEQYDRFVLGMMPTAWVTALPFRKRAIPQAHGICTSSPPSATGVTSLIIRTLALAAMPSTWVPTFSVATTSRKVRFGPLIKLPCTTDKRPLLSQSV